MRLDVSDLRTSLILDARYDMPYKLGILFPSCGMSGDATHSDVKRGRGRTLEAKTNVTRLRPKCRPRCQSGLEALTSLAAVAHSSTVFSKATTSSSACVTAAGAESLCCLGDLVKNC